MPQSHPITSAPADDIPATPIPAAAYYRMSDDEQEGSIEQQRKEVRDFAAANGYSIVAEYVDSGKSGSKDKHKRTGFHRMLMDSHSKEWKALLCWKLNRFSREDSHQGADDKKVLRGNGVQLVTVQEGAIDWDTMEGRIIDWRPVGAEPPLLPRHQRRQPPRPSGSPGRGVLAARVGSVRIRPALCPPERRTAHRRSSHPLPQSAALAADAPGQ
jgi:hypothetical protein